ncbi:MAG: hypothetical protein HWD92_07430 [Flavobacteriia bacterium]|nr:hypothetical protein [Flavobacteriia bacterium]
MKINLSIVGLLFISLTALGQSPNLADTNGRVTVSFSVSPTAVSWDNVNPMESWLTIPFRTNNFDSTELGFYRRLSSADVMTYSARMDYQTWLSEQFFIQFGIEYNHTSVGKFATGPVNGNEFGLVLDERFTQFAGSIGFGYDFLPAKSHDLSLSGHIAGGPINWKTDTYRWSTSDTEGDPTEVVERTGFNNRFEVKLMYTAMFENSWGFTVGVANAFQQSFSPVALRQLEVPEDYARNPQWPAVELYSFNESYEDHDDILQPEKYVIGNLVRIEVGVAYAF